MSYLEEIKEKVLNDQFEYGSIKDCGGANVIITTNKERVENPPKGDLVVYMENGEALVELFANLAENLRPSPAFYKLFALSALKFLEANSNPDYKDILCHIIDDLEVFEKESENSVNDEYLIVLDIVGEEIYGKYCENLEYVKGLRN